MASVERQSAWSLHMKDEPGSPQGTYSIDVIPDTGIALFHWVGPISLQDRFANLNMMTRYCHDHGVSKLIIDGREQEPLAGAIESYDFGETVPMAFRGLSVAVVHHPDDDILKFIETVASNRGSGTRAFVDLDKARAWLDSF